MEIKVISLNIWDGGRLLDEAIAFIKKENPDVIGLQEVYDGRDPALERRFRTFTTLLEELDYVGYDYEAEFMENRTEGLIPQGNAIFSRYPIKTRHGRFFAIRSTKTMLRIPPIMQLFHITFSTLCWIRQPVTSTSSTFMASKTTTVTTTARHAR